VSPVRNSKIMRKENKKTKISNGIKKIQRILITAGPTVEPLDPVRFISNRSTGYMGYELARAAKKRKHRVTLISGPTLIDPPGGVRFLRVDTAEELEKLLRRELKKCDILIMASAVSDFRAASFSKKKIKRRKNLTIRLLRNRDILKAIPGSERKNKIIIGFSLETGNLLRNASEKLKNKGLDLIVANALAPGNTPFGTGRKTVYLLDKLGRTKKLAKMTKTHIARAILDSAENLCYTPF